MVMVMLQYVMESAFDILEQWLGRDAITITKIEICTIVARYFRNYILGILLYTWAYRAIGHSNSIAAKIVYFGEFIWDGINTLCAHRSDAPVPKVSYELGTNDEGHDGDDEFSESDSDTVDGDAEFSSDHSRHGGDDSGVGLRLVYNRERRSTFVIVSGRRTLFQPGRGSDDESTDQTSWSSGVDYRVNEWLSLPSSPDFCRTHQATQLGDNSGGGDHLYTNGTIFSAEDSASDDGSNGGRPIDGSHNRAASIRVSNGSTGHGVHRRAPKTYSRMGFHSLLPHPCHPWTLPRTDSMEAEDGSGSETTSGVAARTLKDQE